MNETADKITSKLLDSIQKSQTSEELNDNPEEPTPTKTKPKAKLKTKKMQPAAPKSKKTETIQNDTDTEVSLESTRQFIGRLRWPD